MTPTLPHLRSLVLAIALLSTVPAAARGQVFTDPPLQDPFAESETLTLAEIRVLLLTREVPVETIEAVLDAFPEDRVFTRDEAEVLIESILATLPPPEEDRDGKLRPEREDRLRREEGAEPALPIARVRPESEVPLFGQSVFRGAPEEFEPAQNIAVGPEYVLGPGDELSILLWGTAQKAWKPVVERDGTVALAPLGVVPAAGLSLGAFRAMLAARLREVYSAFDLSVTVSSLGTVQVSVLGDVRRPGTYTLSPFSTSFNALYYAGGPLETGSLRFVKVYRGDSLLAEEDLYRLLLDGESKGDVRLATGYRVFVPPATGIVTVRGAVRRPARYEVRPGENAADLVRFSGGLTAAAWSGRAVLDRVGAGPARETREIDLDSAETIPVRDGDVLTVYSVYHVDPRRWVWMEGEVQSPGRFELFPGMTVSDLVYRSGNLLESATALRAELTRLEITGDDSTAVVIPLDLDALLAAPGGAADLPLAPHDRVFVRRQPGWAPQAVVDVTGEVRFPGRYALIAREERLSSVLGRAGGFTREAFPEAAGFFRTGSGRIIADIRKAMANPAGIEDVVLADGDSIYVPRYNGTIQVTGEVSRPGALVHQPGKTVEYYLGRTGGLTERADKGRIQIVRVDGVVQTARRTFWFDPEVPPGAVIEVAARPPGRDVDWLGGIRDVATILSGIATTVFIITQID